MHKVQALHNFWGQFGVPAYNQNSVPTEEQFKDMGKKPYPRITYEVETDNFGNTVVLTASLWDRSTSYDNLYRLLDLIALKVTRGGITIPCDGGAIHIDRGVPFQQEMSDPDDSIKRLVLNVEVDFDTEV